MSELYRIVVAVTVAAHFAFVVFGVLGGFLALRWPRVMWFHVPVVLWCVAIELVDFVCPLTWLEEWSRTRAAMAPLGSAGFIDHYITGVWYPVAYEDLALGLAAAAVASSWVLFALRIRSAERPAAARRIHRSHVPRR